MDLTIRFTQLSLVQSFPLAICFHDTSSHDGSCHLQYIARFGACESTVCVYIFDGKYKSTLRYVCFLYRINAIICNEKCIIITFSNALQENVIVSKRLVSRK